MKLLFIPSVLNQDWQHIKMLSAILVILYSCVLVSVLIDLFFGVKRARKLKIARTSYGFRRTITKLTGYFGLMMLLTMADIVASIVFQMPYFTLIGVLGIISVEGKSVFENIKSENKHIEEIPPLLLKLLENRNTLQDIVTYLNTNINKGSKTDLNSVSSEITPEVTG
jgi:hypothetical protein